MQIERIDPGSECQCAVGVAAAARDAAGRLLARAKRGSDAFEKQRIASLPKHELHRRERQFAFAVQSGVAVGQYQSTSAIRGGRQAAIQFGMRQVRAQRCQIDCVRYQVRARQCRRREWPQQRLALHACLFHR